MIEKTPLSIVPQANFKYFVDPNYVSFPKQAPVTPRVYLLNLEVISAQLGKFSAFVIYFVFENYNFLKEILLKHQVSVSHFVKIREGCAFGGNKRSITTFYSLLGNLNTRFLLVDNEIHYSRIIHNEISKRFQIDHKKFDLQELNQIDSWSDLPTKVFKILPQEGSMTQSDLNEILRKISGDNEKDYF